MSDKRNLLIGVDVGGTNSDLVVIDPTKLNETNRGVLAWHKSVTTPDVSDGIEHAIKIVLENPDNDIKKEEIVSVTVGTTHFINAVIERDSNRLEKVAVLRLSGPYGRSSPPFGDFPSDLAEILNGYTATLDGGSNVDGNAIRPLNPVEIKEHCAKIRELGIRAVAIVATFASMNKSHEIEVAKIMQEEIPGCDVVLSHTISGIGFVERENATILNAAIKKFGKKIISSFIHATKNIGLNCTVLLSQNDGTVLSTKDALETPIRTFSSGATNSMRGAAILCTADPDVKGKNVMVCDVGGTTTDVGQLLASGFPRQSATHSYVGGVRMNFSMPHVESIGLGGGSIVRDIEGELTVGPDSTGADIVRRAILFGGETITTSDVTVGGQIDTFGAESIDAAVRMGDLDNVKGKFSDEFKAKYTKVVTKKLEKIIDRMKTSPEPIPVIFVGGGSFIAPDALEGASKVIKPPFFQVANAIGAALGKISSEVAEVKTTQGTEDAKAAIIAELKERAIKVAIEKGALPSSIEVASIISDAVPYVDNVYSFAVKVIGDVDYKRTLDTTDDLLTISNGYANGYQKEEVFKSAKVSRKEAEVVDYVNYRPKVINHEWFLSEIDIECISIGAYILGCGGGGDPSSQTIELKRIAREGGELKVITLDEFERQTNGKGRAINVGYAGSPTISGERLHADEIMEGVALIEKWEGQKTEGIFIFEIGGGNGLSGLLCAYEKGLPNIDLDLMGRAYPTQWQSLPSVYNDLKGYPYLAVSDGNGMQIMILHANDDMHLENILRDTMYHQGVQCSCIEPSMDVTQMRRETVSNPMSLAWRIGREVLIARNTSDIDNLPKRIIGACGGPKAAKCLFKGKIVRVEKKLQRGYGYGVVELESADESSKEKIRIPFKNENIVVYKVDKDGGEAPLCSVPDLITLVDMDGGAVGTQDYRYGLLVFVMVFSPSDKWTTPKGIEIGGPKGFGEVFQDLEYVPSGEYVPPVPVSEEFNQ